MTSITPLISLNNINVYFNRQHILQNIHFNIFPESIVTIVGPNGGGKSTLLKVLLKLITPKSGQVLHQKNLKIGYVPQKLNIENSMPINVQHFLALKPNATKEKIKDVLNLFSIAHLKRHNLHNLSGGQMQRVLLARAVLDNPKLLVLDEPMQGVDALGQVELYQLLNKVRSMLNCAILMVSHDLNIVMKNTDEVICINHHICCSGTPEKVTNNPNFIALFGDKFSKNIAFYSHHHNHHHNLQGDVCSNCHHH